MRCQALLKKTRQCEQNEATYKVMQIKLTTRGMEPFAQNGPNVLVHTSSRATRQPAPKWKSNEMIVVPDDHAIPDDRMHVHGVEKCNLRDVQRHLGVINGPRTKKPRKKSLCDDSLRENI